ncbi:MAG: serine hydrolase [Clostridia bacterium]|nr:serine hydrolase [Clostridia bacterium]
MGKLHKEDIFVIIFVIVALAISAVGFVLIKSMLSERKDSPSSPVASQSEVTEITETIASSEDEEKTPVVTFTDNTYVCIHSKAAVRSGAGETFEQIGEAGVNTSFTYLGEEMNEDTVWYKIQYTDESVGYVSHIVAKKIIPTPKSGDRVINDIAAKYGVMGMQVAVIEKGAVTSTYEYGYALCGERNILPSTKIRIASPSKVVTAMTALHMRDRGVIDFDTDISFYWGAEVRNPMHPDDAITLRHIFSHASSIADCSYGKDISAQLADSATYNEHRPGAAASWSYCNFAVGVAGSTLEKASGITVFDYTRDNLFTPLGVKASFDSTQFAEDELATLYYSDFSVARSAHDMTQLEIKNEIGANTACYAGGLTISALDYAKLLCILANDGSYGGVQYLSPQSVALIEEMQFSATDKSSDIPFYQCLPLRYRNNLYGRGGLYYHTGNAYGVLSLVSYDPQTGDGVVIITTGANATRDSYGIYAVCGEITEYIYTR